MDTKWDLHEKNLITLLKRNDKTAFNELFWKYEHSIYLNVLKLTRHEAIAQDIVQETFITLWEKRSTIDPDKSLSGWLFVLSYNRSLNVLKKNLRESKILSELGMQVCSFKESDEDDQRKTESLYAGIHRLSAQQKRVLELCKLEGKTYEETASEMQISKHTVKEYLSAAMASLRNFVKKIPFLIGLA